MAALVLEGRIDDLVDAVMAGLFGDVAKLSFRYFSSSGDRIRFVVSRSGTNTCVAQCITDSVLALASQMLMWVSLQDISPGGSAFLTSVADVALIEEFTHLIDAGKRRGRALSALLRTCKYYIVESHRLTSYEYPKGGRY